MDKGSHLCLDGWGKNRNGMTRRFSEAAQSQVRDDHGSLSLQGLMKYLGVFLDFLQG